MKAKIKSGLFHAALAAAFLMPVAGPAEEFRVDRLFVIGDSLSDGGAYSQAAVVGSGGTLADTLPDGSGRFLYRWMDNAPDGSSRTYAGALAASLGIPLQPNVITGVPSAAGGALERFSNDINVGGTNFAQGGSRAALQPGNGYDPAKGYTTLPVRQQVDRLLASNPGFNANDMVILWAGANDALVEVTGVLLRGVDPRDAITAMGPAAQSLAADVRRLAAAGAQTILVVTLPDINSTPYGSAAPVFNANAAALLTELGNAFNDSLIGALRGQNAVIVNSQQALSAVLADPARYGVIPPAPLPETESLFVALGTIFDSVSCQNAIGAVLGTFTPLECVQGVNTLPDGERRVFADGVHPSTRTHALFGQLVLAGLQAATQTGAIPVATMNALRQQALALEERLHPAALFSFDDQGRRRLRELGDVDYFFSVGAGYYDSNAGQLAPGMDGETYVVRAGADVVVAPNATVGVSLSLDHGQMDFEGGRGGFDSRLFLATLFAQMALSDTFYVNAAAGVAPIDVYNINRSFQLGPATEDYDASSDGTYFFGRGGIGATLPTMGTAVMINPYLNFTWEEVMIDGFTESPGAASLAFGETEYSSQRLTAGASIGLTPAPDWQFTVRGQLEYDLQNDDLDIPMGPDANTLGTIPMPRPDRSWGYLSLTATRALGRGISLSLGGSTELGLNGSKGFTGTLSFMGAF